MSPHELTVAEQEELVELLSLLDKVTNLTAPTEKPDVDIEKAYARLSRACRLAYGVTRGALKSEEHRPSQLHETALQRMHEDGINSICGALVMEATSQYLDLKEKQDKELFKTEFILALDRAVERAGRSVKERYDEGTEQSAEERTAQPPATS